ncbi:heterokaryon incompatibility protein-domain-containing protein [Cladorrhinum sp. PSN259]|nr:heterokaryon incompatibility protein-domain-containing protein [Cladorrhinum sp. PSN259]
MRVDTEYREPTFNELLCFSIPLDILFCLLSPLVIVGEFLSSVFNTICDIRTIGIEIVRFFWQSWDFITGAWGGLFGDVYILLIKSTRVLMEDMRLTPPRFLRRARRKRGMPRRYRPENTVNAFKYRPLGNENDIRLFVIPPADEGWIDWEDGITGELVTANILTEPAYDALSYSWGSESGDYSCSYRIVISPGTPEEGAVRVTHNCAQAISRLRLEGKPRALWIDAICINQQDLSERSHQVSIMAKIYTSARQVVAYTGRGSNHIDELFDYLNSLDEQAISVPTPPLPPAPDLVTAMRVERKRPGSWFRNLLFKRQSASTTPEEVPAHILPLAADFFNLRYFTRVWTLQETILPDIERTSLVCGTKSTSASRALHVLAILQSTDQSTLSPSPKQTKSVTGALPTNHLLNTANLQTTSPPSYGTISPPSPSRETTTDLGKIFTLVRKRAFPLNPEQRTPKPHLLDILIATRNRNATDPRDRIFGVLSIAWGMDLPLTNPSLYAVDYTLPADKVYTSYSEMFIRHYGAGFWLGLLAYRPLPSSSNPDETGDSDSDFEEEEEEEQCKNRLLPTWAADLGEDFTVAITIPSGRSRRRLAPRKRLRLVNPLWINESALNGAKEKEFPAAKRFVKGDDPSAQTQTVRFEDREWDGNRVMILEGKRRVERGWIIKDVYDQCEDMEATELGSTAGRGEGEEVLVEMYRGLVAVLRREVIAGTGKGYYYYFVQVCAHALTEEGARQLAKEWGKVVVDGEGWEGGNDAEEYLGEMETFRIV